MNALNRFWTELGFKPHKSNNTHFWAGVAIGVTFFPICLFHFFVDRIVSSIIITMLAVIIIASVKEWNDWSQRKKLIWKTWDWLDWIYTVAGTVAVIILVSLIWLAV